MLRKLGNSRDYSRSQDQGCGFKLRSGGGMRCHITGQVLKLSSKDCISGRNPLNDKLMTKQGTREKNVKLSDSSHQGRDTKDTKIAA